MDKKYIFFFSYKDNKILLHFLYKLCEDFGGNNVLAYQYFHTDPVEKIESIVINSPGKIIVFLDLGIYSKFREHDDNYQRNLNQLRAKLATIPNIGKYFLINTERFEAISDTIAKKVLDVKIDALFLKVSGIINLNI